MKLFTFDTTVWLGEVAVIAEDEVEARRLGQEYLAEHHARCTTPGIGKCTSPASEFKGPQVVFAGFGEIHD